MSVGGVATSRAWGQRPGFSWLSTESVGAFDSVHSRARAAGCRVTILYGSTSVRWNSARSKGGPACRAWHRRSASSSAVPLSGSESPGREAGVVRRLRGQAPEASSGSGGGSRPRTAIVASRASSGAVGSRCGRKQLGGDDQNVAQSPRSDRARCGTGSYRRGVSRRGLPGTRWTSRPAIRVARIQQRSLSCGGFWRRGLQRDVISVREREVGGPDRRLRAVLSFCASQS